MSFVINFKVASIIVRRSFTDRNIMLICVAKILIMEHPEKAAELRMLLKKTIDHGYSVPRG